MHGRRWNHPPNYVIKMVRLSLSLSPFDRHFFVLLLKRKCRAHGEIVQIKSTKGLESHSHIHTCKVWLFNGFDVFNDFTIVFRLKFQLNWTPMTKECALVFVWFWLLHFTVELSKHYPLGVYRMTNTTQIQRASFSNPFGLEKKQENVWKCHFHTVLIEIRTFLLSRDDDDLISCWYNNCRSSQKNPNTKFWCFL